MIAAETVAETWRRRPALRYGFAVVTVAAAAALRQLLVSRFNVTPPYTTFNPATVLVAVLGGTGPGVLAALLSAAFAWVFLIEAPGQLSIPNASDAAGLTVFLSMGILISVMAGAVRRRKNRRLASWNTGAKRVTVWSESEIVGQDFSRFFKPEAVSSGRPRQLLAAAAPDGRYQDEAERVRKDGSRSGRMFR